MASYRIEWKASAIRELRAIDRSIVPRIVDAVGKLGQSPYPPGCRKLRGGGDSYRIRVGDYRAVYKVLEGRMTIEIIRVRHRKDVYR